MKEMSDIANHCLPFKPPSSGTPFEASGARDRTPDVSPRRISRQVARGVTRRKDSQGHARQHRVPDTRVTASHRALPSFFSALAMPNYDAVDRKLLNSLLARAVRLRLSRPDARQRRRHTASVLEA